MLHKVLMNVGTLKHIKIENKWGSAHKRVCTGPISRSFAHFLDFFFVRFVTCTHNLSFIFSFCVSLCSFIRPWILSRSSKFSSLYSFLFDHIILMFFFTHASTHYNTLTQTNTDIFTIWMQHVLRIFQYLCPNMNRSRRNVVLATF